MSWLNFGLNARQKMLLERFSGKFLGHLNGCIFSDQLKGTRLEGLYDNELGRILFASAMLAGPKLFNLPNKKTLEFHQEVCKKLAPRIMSDSDFCYRVELCCKFIASCMQHGYGNYIHPAQDDENWAEYFSRAGYTFLQVMTPKAAPTIKELTYEEEFAIGKAFIMGGLETFLLYCETLKAWNDDSVVLDEESSPERNEEQALDKLEAISRSAPYQVMDWCKRHPDDGYVFEGRVGLFNVPMPYRKWNGPYGITLSAHGRSLVYNIYFRDLVSVIDRLVSDIAMASEEESGVISRILATPDNVESNKAIAMTLVDCGIKANLAEAVAYVKLIRDAAGQGLFDDLK